MNVQHTSFKGLYILRDSYFQDSTGRFFKSFNYDTFQEKGLNTDFKKFYYSTSHKNIIRRIYFQFSPLDHAKSVYASHGRILDIILDLRAEYSKEHDSGIRFDSLGYIWATQYPIISKRDLYFQTFNNFNSPF